jgi:predicted nucleotidyltransferase
MNLPEDAKTFIQNHYPQAEVVILAGSFVRGEETSSSDFDIVIIDQSIKSSFRETHRQNGRIIEVFVHSYDSCLQWFDKDLDRKKPSLQNMVMEGVLVAGNDELLAELKAIAIKQIQNGPALFSQTELEDLRYLISDVLDDLIGSEASEEWIFIANDLVPPVLKLDMVMRGHWLASGKRIPRHYEAINRRGYKSLVAALHCLYSKASKKELIGWAYDILNQYGGRLDQGYCRGKTGGQQDINNEEQK